MTKEKVQEIAFEMIALIAEPKYIAYNAMKEYYKDRDKEKVLAEIKKSKILLAEAGKKHFELIKKEAEGGTVEFSLILMHAEDQYLTTQSSIELLEVIVHGVN